MPADLFLHKKYIVCFIFRYTTPGYRHTLVAVCVLDIKLKITTLQQTITVKVHLYIMIFIPDSVAI